MTDEQPKAEPESSDQLLGDLAHEVSILVRSDLELAVAEHGAQLRHVAMELGVALAAGAALLLAFATLSWAAVQGLTLAIPSWGASLVVAAVWAIVTGLLLWLEHPRRLVRRLSSASREQAVESARLSRSDAEQAMKATAERLGQAVARETAERGLKAGFSAAEHMVAEGEHDAGILLKELLVALTAPGRAGISLLERLVGRSSPDDTAV